MTDFLKREGREVVGSGRCRRESPSQRLGLKTGKLRPREAKQLVQYHSGKLRQRLFFNWNMPRAVTHSSRGGRRLMAGHVEGTATD